LQEVAELRGLTGDDDLQNSFIIRAAEAPGVVLSKLVSRSEGSLRELELLGKDEGQMENNGTHPWSIANDTVSTLLLFNHSSTAAYFNVKLADNKSSMDESLQSSTDGDQGNQRQ
jgi:hypothetical protein